MAEIIQTEKEYQERLEAFLHGENGMHTHDGVHYHSHSDEHEHDHEHDHDHEHTHDHSHGHSHGEHGHVHTNTKAVINRLSRAIGHLESVKRMVEEGRDCTEVLIQLAAVKSAINNTGKVILKDHIDHCIIDAVACGDLEAITDLEKAIDHFIK